MTVSTSTDSFLDLLRKSGAVEPRRLEAFLAKQGPLPDDAEALAELLVQNGLITRYQADPLLKGKLQRFLLSGKYRVLDRLGAGGMASVFLCEHRVMRRRVAIKVLPPQMAKNASAVDRFHREARAAAALHHPNIVGAHDVDVDGNFHFLVTEFVDGRNLHEMVRMNGTLSIERAAHYITQAALGLQHAYERGMVHRDIKPANLLLDRTGTVKILDMGLALLFLEDDDNLTKEHDAASILGTAEFLAPEQAMDSHGVDIRADIYSLGMTLYFLLSGKTPFGEGTTAQKLIWHQIRPPKPIQEYRPDVPAEYWAVVEKMLAKAPADRFQTPIEVVMALQPWTSTPIPPPAESEMPKPQIPLAQDSPTTEGGYTGAGMSYTSLPAINLPSLLDAATSSPGSRPPPTKAAPPSNPGSSPARPAATPAPSSRPARPVADPASPTAGPAARTTADAPRAAVKAKAAIADESDSGSDIRTDVKKKKKKKAEAKNKSKLLLLGIGGGVVMLLAGVGLVLALTGEEKPKSRPTELAAATTAATSANTTPTKSATKKGGQPTKRPEPTKSTPATKPVPPPTPPATKPTPPPTTSSAPKPKTAPEFFPIKEREQFYDVFLARQGGWEYARQRMIVQKDGTIEVAVVQQGFNLTPTTADVPPARNVNAKLPSLQVRKTNSLIELGSAPTAREKDPLYEPILKLWASEGDTWKYRLPNGDDKVYEVVSFGKWGDNKSSVTIRTQVPYNAPGIMEGQLITNHVYVRDVGEVERTASVSYKTADGKEQTVPSLFMKLRD